VGSPTAALLWAACRPVPDDAKVAESVQNGADLAVAARTAITQRVSPLLWRALQRVPTIADIDDAASRDPHPTDDWLGQLQRDAARCRAQSLLLMPRLGELVLTPLADAGFEALLFKGAALAPRYPEAGLRPMDDVDLILPPDQVDGAIATLVSTGWRVRPGPARRTHEVDLVHEALPGIPLDLHRELTTWRDRTNKLSGTDLWKWRRPTTLYGAPSFTLPPEPELVALAAHAAKPFHTFERLMWSVDVAIAITAAGDTIDWAAVTRLARRAECTTALAVVLGHAARLGVETPPTPRRSLSDVPMAATLAPVLSPEWPFQRHAKGERSLVRYALIDTWRGRAVLATTDITEEGLRGVAPRTRDLAARSLRQWLTVRRARRSGDVREQDVREHGGNPGEPRGIEG
jgi:hypothetical protein